MLACRGERGIELISFLARSQPWHSRPLQVGLGCAIRASRNDDEITISLLDTHDYCAVSVTARALLLLRRSGARDLDFS
jgi:hypothetical protein